MKNLLLLFTLIFAFPLWAQRTQPGHSSLEGEFIKQSNIKMPVVYTAISGLSFDLSIPADEVSQTEDDLFGDVTGMSVNAGPIAYGGFEKTKRIVSEEVSERNDLVIEQASPDSPFYLIESLKWDLGIGVEIYTTLPTPIGLIGGSVAFLKGKNYYSIRRFSGPKEARSKLLLPVSRENLKSWKVGDQLFYATRGGAVFNVFLGLKPFISLGPEYIHSGSYRIRSQLIEENLMEIEVTTTRTDSIGLEAVNLPVKFELSKGKGHLNALIYHFDLTNPGALKGMAHLYHGRFDLTNQQMLSSGGKIKLSTKINHTYTSLSGKAGIPFIWSMGGGLAWAKSEGEFEKDYDGESAKFEAFSSSDIREYYSKGILSSHKWFNETVSSTVLRNSNAENSVITSFYSWSLSKNNMNERLLQKRFQKLARIFGLPKLAEIKLPSKRMGYVKADFTINFSGADILNLLNTNNLEVMGKNAVDSLAKDFTKYGHKTFCRIRDYQDCFNRHVSVIKEKHETLVSLTNELDTHYKNDGIRKVTTKLTKIVKHLFSSRYLTRAYAEMRPELFFELRLEGEKIKKHVIRL